MNSASQLIPIQNPSWWKNKRSKMARSSMFLNNLAVLFIVIMTTIPDVTGFKLPPNRKLPYKDTWVSNHGFQICETRGCVKAAKNILRNMDKTVDPCDDFYKFACGGWSRVPDSRGFADVFTDTQDETDAELQNSLKKLVLTGAEPTFIVNMKRLYDTCMNIDSIGSKSVEPLQELLNRLGGWPVVKGQKWNYSAFNWIDTLIQLRQIGCRFDIFMLLHIEFIYNSSNVVTLNRVYFNMDDAEFVSMLKIAIKFGADPQWAKYEMWQVSQFVRDLVEISLSKEEQGNAIRTNNTYTLKELQKMVPEINWLYFLRQIFRNEDIHPEEPIKVTNPNFMKRVAQLISRVNKRTVANFMMWKVATALFPLLSQEWRELYNRQPEAPRWLTCINILKKRLATATNSYYVKHVFKDSKKDLTTEMVGYLHRQILHNLENVDWMDAKTKAAAIEKTKAMLFFTGYPDELANDTIVSEYYKDLVLGNESYIHIMMNISLFSKDSVFSLLRKPNIRGEWKKYIRATEMSAQYEATENSIYISAAYLRNAYFSEDRPQYLNFGGIGSVIGHEITHGFDNIGRHYDKVGNFTNWWDPTSDNIFREKTQCIIDQYGSYYIPAIGVNVNGTLTQNENIADNGGMKAAYWAYQTWVKDNGMELPLPGLKYTPGQLFWISTANTWCASHTIKMLWNLHHKDVHSLPRFRVIGSMSNLDEFAHEFQCPQGSPMNPPKKCKVW